MPALQPGHRHPQPRRAHAGQRRWVAQFFQREVQPLLVPVGLDPAHPFPQVANKSLNFIVRLAGDAFGRENSIAIVKVPRVLPRVIRCRPAVHPGAGLRAADQRDPRPPGGAVPGRIVEAFSQFRVTRDSDLDVDEDDVANLRQALRSGLSTRHFGKAVRLEVVASCRRSCRTSCCTQFDLPEAALYRVNGPVNLVRLNQLIDQADAPALRFAPHEPAWPRPPAARPPAVRDHRRTGRCLLHHPFESFEVVVQFLREAVDDPQVLAIKQTIYRTGSESVLMELLLEAARRGKEVLAVVELKARFDEEANINWAERLEAVGARWSTASSASRPTPSCCWSPARRRAACCVRYAHLSTGNYNPKTAQGCTPTWAMLTADPDLTADADAVFQQLASLTRCAPPRQLLVAPFNLHRRLGG
jgi:polyphosphate kinase